jgi:hypothetical protein
MDDACLEPQTGTWRSTSALTSRTFIHNGQLNVPLPNAKAGESENPQLACSCPAFLEFVLSPPQKCTSAPAKLYF